MMKPRISLLAEHEREDQRTKIGDPLVGLTKHVDFEALAELGAETEQKYAAHDLRTPHSVKYRLFEVAICKPPEADQVGYNARTLDEPACSTSKGCASDRCDLGLHPPVCGLPAELPTHRRNDGGERGMSVDHSSINR